MHLRKPQIETSYLENLNKILDSSGLNSVYNELNLIFCGNNFLSDFTYPAIEL
jgi:hypothetical protein